jgi:hypothetical protein
MFARDKENQHAGEQCHREAVPRIQARNNIAMAHVSGCLS